MKNSNPIPKPNPLLPNRLVALTYCIRSSLIEGKFDEVNQMLSERQVVIDEMNRSQQSLTEEERKAIKTADDAARETMRERRQELVQRLRSLNSVRKVRNAYRTR